MERSVLGACLESGDELLLAVIDAGLKADDFAVSDHQRIFSKMVEMHEKHVPIDLHSVAEALGRRDGYPLIADLIVGVVSQRDHVLYHAKVIIKLSRLRKLAKLGEWMITSAGQIDADPQCLLTDTEAHLGRI